MRGEHWDVAFSSMVFVTKYDEAMQAGLEKERYEVIVVWAWVADQRNLWGADGETLHSYGFSDIPARGSDDERMLGYLFGEVST